MPIKVKQDKIDADVAIYGVCYIETDHMGNERRIDPLQLKQVSGNSSVQQSRRYSNNPFGTALEAMENKLELHGVFNHLTFEYFCQIIGRNQYDSLANVLWEVIKQHGYLIVKKAPVDYASMIDHKSLLQPIKLRPESVDKFKEEWEKYLRQNPSVFMALEQVENEQEDRMKIDSADAIARAEFFKSKEIKCTCRDNDKYARPLCPVCDKEKYEAAQQFDINEIKKFQGKKLVVDDILKAAEEINKHFGEEPIKIAIKPIENKPEDIISPADFFKSIKGDI